MRRFWCTSQHTAGTYRVLHFLQLTRVGCALLQQFDSLSLQLRDLRVDNHAQDLVLQSLRRGDKVEQVDFHAHSRREDWVGQLCGHVEPEPSVVADSGVADLHQLTTSHREPADRKVECQPTLDQARHAHARTSPHTVTRTFDAAEWAPISGPAVHPRSPSEQCVPC